MPQREMFYSNIYVKFESLKWIGIKTSLIIKLKIQK